MTTFIVRERSDGRGGIKPFNSYTSKQKGAVVTIGDKTIKVTSDGRLNIPASIMKQYGVKGSDGRYRIGIKFSAGSGKDGWKKVSAAIIQPDNKYKDAKQGSVITKPSHKANILVPSDAGDYTWSPQ